MATATEEEESDWVEVSDDSPEPLSPQYPANNQPVSSSSGASNCHSRGSSSSTGSSSTGSSSSSGSGSGSGSGSSSSSSSSTGSSSSSGSGSGRGSSPSKARSSSSGGIANSIAAELVNDEGTPAPSQEHVLLSALPQWASWPCSLAIGAAVFAGLSRARLRHGAKLSTAQGKTAQGLACLPNANPPADVAVNPQVDPVVRDAPRSIRCLLLGQTGGGKTRLLDLVCAWARLNMPCAAEGDRWKQELQRVSHVEDNESRLECGMSSQTMAPRLYAVDLGNKVLEVIDTPGFGDTQGIEQDKENVFKIVKYLREEVESLNGIILVINGREARMTAQLSYVFSQVSSIMPKAVLQQTVVAFTNCQDKQCLNFKVDSLKDFLGNAGIEQGCFCLDNPMAMLSNNGGLDKVDCLRDVTTSSFQVLHQLLQKLQNFEEIYTIEFSRLYDAREELERRAMNLIEDYRQVSELIEEGRREEEKLQEASLKSQELIDYRRKHSFRQLRFVEIDHCQYTMVCRSPGCRCSFRINPGLLSLQVSKDLMCPTKFIFKDVQNHFRRNGGCRCEHAPWLHQSFKQSQRVHVFREELLYGRGVERLVNEAKSHEEKQEVLVKALQEELNKRLKLREKIVQDFVVAVDEYEAHATKGIYLAVLTSQLEVLDLALKSSSAKDAKDHEKLLQAKAKLSDKLQVVSGALQHKSRL